MKINKELLQKIVTEAIEYVKGGEKAELDQIQLLAARDLVDFTMKMLKKYGNQFKE